MTSNVQPCVTVLDWCALVINYAQYFGMIAYGCVRPSGPNVPLHEHTGIDYGRKQYRM